MAESIQIKVEADTSQAMRAIKKLDRATRPKNPRNVLYIFYIPLLLFEWSVTLVFNVVEQIANAITELTLSLKRFIHAEAKPADTKQPDTK